MKQAWQAVASVTSRTTPLRIESRSGPEPIVWMSSYRYARSSVTRRTLASFALRGPPADAC